MIKKGKLTLLQRFPMDSFSADVHVMCNVTKVHSFTRNFLGGALSFICTHVISCRFNGENDNVMLELPLFSGGMLLLLVYLP